MTAIESKQLTLADTVNKMEPEFARALPKHIPSDRFTRIAVSAINSNPELLRPEVDRRALYAACMQAAQDGLILDKKEAALVMFGNKPTYMAMVAGVLKKMRNSGEIAGVTYGIVYQKEVDQGLFEYIKGDSESLTHKPILFGEKGEFVGVYAVVTTKDGFKIREFLDKKQIEKIRNVSRSKNNGPWVQWFEEMAVKSVLRKVAKISPSSTDLDTLFKNDDETSAVDDHGEPVQVTIEHSSIAEPVAEKPKRQTRAKAVVAPEPVSTPEPDLVELEAEYDYVEEIDSEELPI